MGRRSTEGKGERRRRMNLRESHTDSVDMSRRGSNCENATRLPTAPPSTAGCWKSRTLRHYKRRLFPIAVAPHPFPKLSFGRPER